MVAFPSKLAALFVVSSLVPTSLYAQNATWLTNASSNDFNAGGNWSTAVVPTGTGSFGASAQSEIAFSSNTTLSGLSFSGPLALGFSIGTGLTVTLTGVGISGAGPAPALTADGTLRFTGSSSAGGAIIINNGNTLFTGTSSGGSAHVINGASGVLDISGLTSGTALGSLEGSGAINLGSRRLTVGSLGTSTEFSGVIANGGASGGTAGTLTKVGVGTLTLSGDNTYSGTTTVTAGTLEIGNGGTAGSVAGSIVDNSTLQFNRSDTLTYGGVISGTGSVIQVGSGTTVLSGANTFTGGTTILGGTLQIGAGGTTGSIVGNVLNDGALSFNRANSLTYAGIISGSGSVSQLGSGTTILTGANNYSGGTFVLGGTLQGSATSLQGDISNDATVAFNQSGTGTYAGVISGSGAVTKLGSGTIVLEGDNTFSGNTTISAGTLQFGSGGTSGSVVGNVINNASVRFNRSDGVTYAAAISGSGSLVQAGAGTTTLTGTNTYSGTTTISAGTLQIGDGGTAGSVAGNIVDNASLHINRSDTLSYGGVISGTGSISQIGSGTTIFSGANTYTGGTTISNGTLQIGNGGTAGAITGNVLNDGILSFNRSNSLTYAGVISGTGSVSQIGSGTTILTGANIYTGGTLVSAGTLQGNATSLQGDISNAGNVTFNQSGSGIFGGTIYGSGSVTKIGTGTTIFSADNSYAGNTTITAGALQLGNGGTTGSLGGNIAVTGSLRFDRSDALTYGGVISGAGSVVQAGSGTTILTGANTYTGTTTIASGALQIGDGGTSGAIAGNIVNNSSLEFDRADTLLYGSVISGTGTVAYTGQGTTILAGANTYSGGTTLSNGTLQIGNGGTTGSIAGNVFNEGVLAFSRSNTLTYAGAISGSGSVVKDGAGTTILTGMNTYTGGTVVNSGVLQGNATSLQGDISNAGNVTFNQSGTGTYAGTVSGSGGLTKLGTGTLVLTGDHSYSGGTSITAGSLQLGDGGTAGSLVGNVTNTGSLRFNRTDTIAYDGIISGTGSVVQGGSGTTVLTGNNTYSGTTTVSAGVLQIGDGGTSGAVVSNIVDNATVRIHRADTWAYGGRISGTGSLFLDGPGTIVLTNTNTHTGGTTINGGVLQVGAGGTTGSIAGTVLNNGAIIFDRSNTLTHAGAITGIGSLVKEGGGTTILTGANNYSGGTLISAGTLQGNATSLQGDIWNQASLTFNQSGTGTYAGIIGGIGNVNKIGSGTVIVANENTYTGGTTISAGVLQIGAGGVTGSLTGDLLNNGAVRFNRADTFVHGGVISGTGALIQGGFGTTILPAANTYLGSTSVTSGKLVVNGSLASTVNVQSAGTLGGGGTIGGLVATGVVSPGNSIGTLNVTGNASFASGSTYQVEADASGNSDKLLVAGSATLAGGTVQVTFAPGAYAPNTTYQVLSAAGGLSGNFGALSSNFGTYTFLAPQLLYDANNVFVTLGQSLPFASVAQTANQLATASALDSLGFGHPVTNALAFSNAAQAQSALRALSGDLHASAQTAMIEDSNLLRHALIERLRQSDQSYRSSGRTSYSRILSYTGENRAAVDQGLEASGFDEIGLGPKISISNWGQAVGSWGQREADSNASGLSRQANGLVTGMDLSFDRVWRFGWAGAFIQSTLRSSNGGHAELDGYGFASYGGGSIGPVRLRAATAMTLHDLHVSRSVVFPGLRNSLESAYAAGTAQAFGEVGYEFGSLNKSLEPYASITGVKVRTERFREQGGAAALEGEGRSRAVFATIGVRSSAQFAIGEALAALRGSIGWRHAISDSVPRSTVSFGTNAIDPFTVSGLGVARNTALVGAGLDVWIDDRVRLGLEYEGQLSSAGSDHSARASFALALQ